MSHVVCHLIASNFAGGPEKQILEQCGRLPTRGWQALIGSFRENRPQVEIIEAARAKQVPVFLIETRSPFSVAAVSQLRRALNHSKADVLVTHGYKPNVVGWLASGNARWRQIPFVRGYTGETWRVRRYEELDRWILRQFPHVLCVSEGTKRRLQEFRLRPERIHVVHNAVDCALGSQVEPRDLRAEFSFPQDSMLLVAAGRLSPEKGHRVLIDALRVLLDDAPTAHLVLLGSGAEEAALRRQVEQSGLTRRIAFAGFRRDVLACLAAADVVVNPSFTEGLPNVLLEAFSLGRPVVATDVGGTAELVQDGRSGWLVPAGNPAALARSLAVALNDGALARKMGERARQRVESHFSFEAQTEDLVRIYASLLSSPRSTGPAMRGEST